jgi:hypothetical protein
VIAAPKAFEYYSNISDMIDVGKMVCMSARRTGSTEPAINGLTAAGFTSNIERGAILVGAANNMWPDIWPAMNAHAAQIAAEQAPPLPTSAEPVGDY